jgi:hypothetical protein
MEEEDEGEEDHEAVTVPVGVVLVVSDGVEEEDVKLDEATFGFGGESASGHHGTSQALTEQQPFQPLLEHV